MVISIILFIFALENGLNVFQKHFKCDIKTTKVNKNIDNYGKKEENYSDSAKKRCRTCKGNAIERDNGVQRPGIPL